MLSYDNVLGISLRTQYRTQFYVHKLTSLTCGEFTRQNQICVVIRQKKKKEEKTVIDNTQVFLVQ